jgi:hypothetical protein
MSTSCDKWNQFGRHCWRGRCELSIELMSSSIGRIGDESEHFKLLRGLAQIFAWQAPDTCSATFVAIRRLAAGTVHHILENEAASPRCCGRRIARLRCRFEPYKINELAADSPG